VAGMNGCGQLIGLKGRSGHWMDQIQFVFDQQPIENVYMVPIEIDVKSAFEKYQEIVGDESKDDKQNDEIIPQKDLMENNEDELNDQEFIMIQSLSNLKFVQSSKESISLFMHTIDEIGKVKLVLGE
jgi:hypothetical protein